MNKWKFHQKEHFDENIVDSAFKKSTENKDKELKTHLIYAGRYYYYRDAPPQRLRSFILEVMKKHKLKSVMVTTIFMYRKDLITKEKMEDYCKGNDVFHKHSHHGITGFYSPWISDDFRYVVKKPTSHDS